MSSTTATETTTPAPFSTLTTTGTSENATTVQPRNVETTLNFYLDTGEPPKPVYVGKPETFVRPYDVRPVTVHDARGAEAQYTLDVQGFQFVQRASEESRAGFVNDEHIKSVYYPEVDQLLRDVTGATKVHIFDHTIRRPAPPSPEEKEGAPLLRGPVQSVHVDQSYPAARNRVTHHFPGAEGEELLKRRHAIINVWRPIKKILKDPLGFADARSVPEADLVPIGLIYPDRRGETLSVRYSEGQKWYYLYGQDVDEVTLIKCYDSKTDGRARRIPHSAFVNPAHEGDEARESIEVRTLVFWDEDAE